MYKAAFRTASLVVLFAFACAASIAQGAGGTFIGKTLTTFPLGFDRG